MLVLGAVSNISSQGLGGFFGFVFGFTSTFALLLFFFF